VNQIRYFQKKVEESLDSNGLKLVNVEGQPFDPGMAASALNLGDFGPDDVLLVDQMLEPIIMGPKGAAQTRHGNAQEGGSMKYIGIDLGTTNSAICSFDGEKIHAYKSPDQHDVTPSAIFIDRRGNKYVGSRAYDSAARTPTTRRPVQAADGHQHARESCLRSTSP
jgi:hypothetical protein